MWRSAGVCGLLISVVFLMFGSPIFAAKDGDTGNSQWSWAVSSLGDLDGLGQGVCPGSPFKIFLLNTYLPKVDTDPTDKWISGRFSWSQPGFPYTAVVKAAQLCIIHGGFRAGTLYLLPSKNNMGRIALGNISCGETEDPDFPNVLKRDCFDLTDFSALLCEDEVKFSLEIPLLSANGSFINDAGAVDIVEIAVYGLHR